MHYVVQRKGLTQSLGREEVQLEFWMIGTLKDSNNNKGNKSTLSR